MFGTTWDIVRPRYWHPLASLEQSMMEMDEMADRMFRSRFPFYDDDDTRDGDRDDHDHDDFFSDLPGVRGSRHSLRSPVQTDRQQQQHQQQQHQQKQQQQQQQQKPEEKQQPHNEQEQAAQQPPLQQQQPQQLQQEQRQQQQQRTPAFSSYSFSNSSVVDDKGRRVVSTRRRYEDSTGRLKAVHERQMDGKTLRAVWNRMDRDDAGRHDTICSSGTPEEFEQAWKTTPFGEAHERHRLEHQQQKQQQGELHQGEQHPRLEQQQKL